MATREGYSKPQIALHWVTAALVGFNYLYSDGMGNALDARLEGAPAPTLQILPNVHVWVGVAVLLLVVLRLGLRMLEGNPVSIGSGLTALAATWGHRLLYLLLFVVPALGAITWFGGFDATGEPHVLMANVILAVAGLHALLALFHQFVLKDGSLSRMLRSK